MAPDKENIAAPPRRVVELFSGVGGFRLGLEKAGWEVVWSNQWEPSTKTQHASDCYVSHFGPDGHSNENISVVLDQVEAGKFEIPAHELLVGGFPCQDYSVAKVLNQAEGLRGKKGVLWWEIERLIARSRPKHIFLENVDRLLKSPAAQRGRDFAVILASLADLDYVVEWRVVNAADYGFPQRRRRVFIVAHRSDAVADRFTDPFDWLTESGVLATSLPIKASPPKLVEDFSIAGDLVHVSETFGVGQKRSPFLGAGFMIDGKVATVAPQPRFRGRHRTLGEVLLPDAEVPEEFYIPEAQLSRWSYLKGSKKEERTDKKTGFSYFYNEGPVAFPDPLDKPARTILTGEGGSSPSRFKHVVQASDGRLRRLTPAELEQLNGFPKGWTATGMPDTRRAFMMGNALVVGLIERVGNALAEVSGSGTPR